MQEPVAETEVVDANIETSVVESPEIKSADVEDNGSPTTAGDDKLEIETDIEENGDSESRPQEYFKEALEQLGEDLESSWLEIEEFQQIAAEHGLDVEGFQQLAEELGVAEIIKADIASPEKLEQIANLFSAAQEGAETKGGALNNIAVIALALLKEGSTNVDMHFNETLPKDSREGILKLLNAFLDGAGHNSPGSISRAESAANPEDVVSADDFFKVIRDNPQKALENLEGAIPELKKAGWDMGNGGESLLREGRSSSQKAREALQAVLIGSDETEAKSLIDLLNNASNKYVLWQEVGGVLAQRLFGKKMIALDTKDVLEDLRGDGKKASGHAYFGN